MSYFTKEDYDDFMEEEHLNYLKGKAEDAKVWGSLYKYTSPKVISSLEFELKQHVNLGSSFAIVDVSDCVGVKRRFSEFTGYSSPIRWVYDDTSSCSYSGSYGGDVYFQLGKGKYLRAFIAG
jgi:hypothetical protein